MNKQTYMAEIRRRLTTLFQASKEGLHIASIEKHQLEGFMQAGIFLGLTEKAELQQLLDAIHLEVFDQTMQERSAHSPIQWSDTSIDYRHYERPAYERR